MKLPQPAKPVLEAQHRPVAQRLLLALLIAQAALLAIVFSGNYTRVPEYLGFVPGKQGTGLAWPLAAVIAVLYVASASTISDVRRYLFRADSLKLLAVVGAVMAGILEEVVFRKLLMDALQERGYGVAMQVAASALGFGVVHIVWGLKSIAAGINAVLSTTLLGGALAFVYVVGERSLAPCVAAHIMISALIEPGLMLGAVSGRIGLWREKRPA